MTRSCRCMSLLTLKVGSTERISLRLSAINIISTFGWLIRISNLAYSHTLDLILCDWFWSCCFLTELYYKDINIFTDITCNADTILPNHIWWCQISGNAIFSRMKYGQGILQGNTMVWRWLYINGLQYSTSNEFTEKILFSSNIFE